MMYAITALLLFAGMAHAQPVRSIFVCPAAEVTACNAAAAEVDKVGGEFTFTVPLCAETDGREACDVVAYITNWQFQRAAARQAFLDGLERRGIRLVVGREDYQRPDPASDAGKAERVISDRTMRRREAAIEGEGR